MIQDTNEITPDIDRLISLIRDGKVILWIGSGFSLYAGYPSANRFADIICNAAQTSADGVILKNSNHTLMAVAEEYQQLYGRDSLIEIISKHFNTVPSSPPTAHALCTKIPQIDKIITTNYDRLFENVYGDALATIVGDQFRLPSKDKVTLFKIHGDTSDKSSVIITSKDYASFYKKLDTLVWDKVRVMLAENSILFIGYSLEDKNIEDIFDHIFSQMDLSASEFFIAIPSLPDHKLNHFNKMCKTTHIPITGEKLVEIIERDVRENIVSDVIDKKISMDQAQAISYDHGLQLYWQANPNGRDVCLSVDRYVLNPLFGAVIAKEMSISTDSEAYKKMRQFLDDCDCTEAVFSAEDVVLLENINGIKIPQNNFTHDTRPSHIKVEKQEQIERLTLKISGEDAPITNVITSTFEGSVRKRVNIHFSCLKISILREKNTSAFSLSFNGSHKAEDALKDLSILSAWAEGKDIVFYRDNIPVLSLPNITDTYHPQVESVEYIARRIKLYREILELEEILDKEFNIPSSISSEDSLAIVHLLAKYGPREVGDIIDLNLEMEYDEHKIEVLRTPISHGRLTLIEDEVSNVVLFGENYTLGMKRLAVIAPTIANLEEAERLHSTGQPAPLKIISSIGRLILEYV